MILSHLFKETMYRYFFQLQQFQYTSVSTARQELPISSTNIRHGGRCAAKLGGEKGSAIEKAGGDYGQRMVGGRIKNRHTCK